MLEECVNIDEFIEERECDYKGEHYSVRDNGAIMRHANNERKRPNDEKWTFGKKDNTNGYMLFGGERVHIIVATAFHGEHDSKVYVVDHIDTNRCNNRPDNLRWLTRLENVLNNPVTRKRIEYLCGGDLQRFLDNPSCLHDLTGSNTDIMWMRAVTSAEAKAAYNRVMSWANKPSDETPSNGGKMGEWIYKQQYEDKSWQPDFSYKDPDLADVLNIPKQEEIPMPRKESSKIVQPMEIFRKFTNPQLPKDLPTANEIQQEEPKFLNTSNHLAVQIGWTPYTKPEFPCCPTEVSNQPIKDYFDSLKVGEIFVTASYGSSLIFDFTLYKDKILVITKIPNGVKNFALTEIEWNGEVFIHKSHGTFFDENGVRASYTQLQDQEWTGGDSIDFYC